MFSAPRALAGYAAAGGAASIDRGRLCLFNAACAVSSLALRAGSQPHERPAGRTLAEDLRWTRVALEKIGA